MQHEIEVTVLDIDKEEIINKLNSLGAKQIQDTRLVVDWYRTVGVKEGEDLWFLRIRSNSEGKHEVTWKAKSDSLQTARKHKEINFSIEHPDKLEDLFEELGLEKYAHQEKDRTSFTYKDWQFDIDTYPGMPPYMEIEGKGDNHVKEAMKLLGVLDNRTWNKGERILIQEIYNIDWYDMRF